MSRSKRFIAGISLGYINQALVVLSGLWLTPFLLKRLGDQEYGLWVVGVQLLHFLSLLDLGVLVLLPREVALASAAPSLDQMHGLIERVARMSFAQTPLVMLAAFVGWMCLPPEWAALSGPLGVAFLVYSVTFPLRMFRGTLEGLQDTKFLGTLQIVAWSAGAAATILLAANKFGIYSITAGWVATHVIQTAGCIWRVWSRHRAAIPVRLSGFDRAAALDHLRRALWVSFGQVAGTLVNGSEFVMIGYLLGPTAVVIYACTGKLISVLAHQPQLLMQVAQPGLSQLRAGADRTRIFQVTGALTQTMLLISGAVACITWAVNEPFIGWWVGADKFGGRALTGLCIAQMVLRHWNVTSVYSIFCFGHERHLSVTALAEGVVTAAAALPLISFLGPIGAPLAAIAGLTFVSLPRNLRVLAAELEISVTGLIRLILPVVWRILLCGALAGVGAQAVPIRGLTGVAIAAALTALLYLCLTLPVLLRAPAGPYVKALADLFLARIPSLKLFPKKAKSLARAAARES